MLENITDTIILGDSSQILRSFPNESFDACVTDPIYNIDLQYDNISDNKKDAEFWLLIDTIFRDVIRVLKPSSYLVFTCAQKQIFKYKEILESKNLVLRHVGVWHNPNRKNGAGYPGHFPYAWEPVMFFTKGKFRKLNNGNGVGSTDVWIEPSPAGTEIDWHKAARPLRMWRDLVRLCTNENEIILDPFFGSGTTGVVAKEMNRHYVGVEISERYIELSRKRIDATIKQKKLIDTWN